MTTDRVLVVGSGFLGRASALRLVAAGCRVTVLSPSAGTRPWPGGISALNGRQEDQAMLSALLAEHETVIHAAWGTTPGSSAGHPAMEAEQGLQPFLAFLETLRRFPATRLLFMSSGGTVYGDPPTLPVAEAAPLRPRSCHGAGKAAAEMFLHAHRPERTAILRPSNIYGPEQPLRSGFGVIRHLLACVAEERTFQLWGDGLQLRDYLYIDDFAEAVQRLAMRRDIAGTFNLGSGTGTSLRELVALVEEVSGRRVGIDQRPARAGDVLRIVLDNAALSAATGWHPATSLWTGIERTWRCMSQT
ncbi:MAG: NAD-dependent epimerase/dehydratase family protein [Rhodocyclaceae bacterium]|jgi:UDP-glucose 4-epimerase|nr:NAD-dependent epimerase/dehydratase family protein [Rhodocyclaceae bacterium]